MFHSIFTKRIITDDFKSIISIINNFSLKMETNFVNFELASKLVQQYGSPLYVYSKEKILENIKLLQQAAQGYHISYAMKANSNPEILKVIRDNGKGIKYVDTVSPGEILRALESGFSSAQILYTQNFISSEEVDFAIEKGVTLNVGALSTLQYFGQKLKDKQIFIRINPDIGAGQNYKVITGGPLSKFGICSYDLEQTIKIAAKYNIKIVGLHQHIGSNLKLKDKNVFIETSKFIFEKSKMFTDLKYINVGGGIGVKYRKEEQLMNIAEVYNEIKAIRDFHNKDLEIWIEPGRFIVANAGILLCKVTARKQTSEKVFYGTDTGFNHLIRPALYGSHHNIENLSLCDLPQEKSVICGNICECTDNLGTDIMISARIGDILCIENAGAYGFIMSSNFNERPRPAEVLLEEGNKERLIRRRETYEDLKVKI